MIAPFKRKRRTMAVDPGIRDLFQLIKSDAWPPMMEKHLGLDPGFYSTAVPSKPPVPGHVPPRSTRTAEAPSTPSNTRGPSVYAYQSSLSRPPYCNSCGFHHGPTYTQCSSASTPITTPSNAITTDDIEAATTELSPHSPQGTDRSTLSSVINSLTSSNAASVRSLIEVDTAPTDLAASFDFEGA